jgi:N utilization substance protein A
VEGIIPRSEQIPSESYRVGERIRAIVSEVKKVGSRVRIVLSRTSPDFVASLFELEVPEISEGVVEIKGISREAGHRTKIAVHSTDAKVDAVGACVGVKGSRIKIIVDELNGEKIDIVRWSDDLQTYIASALKPAEISEIELDEEAGRARVLVADDQLSLAIGKHGQNVRLASQLVALEIDVMGIQEQEKIEAGLTEQEEPAEEEALEPEAGQELLTEEEAPESEADREPQAEAEEPRGEEPPETDPEQVESVERNPDDEDADQA